MAPGWFAPPNPHPMRAQQGPQPGGTRFHPGQRMPPGGMNGGAPSPHTHGTYHQRSSPPMRGPYPGHGHHGGPRPHAPPPHGVVAHHHGPRMPQGGRFQMQHQQGVVVGGPRPLPPNAGGPNPMARHHAPSPGMPRRMPIPPPNAMRPIPQQMAGPGGHYNQRGPGMQQPPQHGPPRGMQQHMMQQQPMHQQRPAFHHHPHHHPSSMPLGNPSHPQIMQRQGSEDSENRMQQPPHFHSQPPPGTPEQRPSENNGTNSRSPSPPAIPPPPSNYQDQEQSNEGAQRPPTTSPSAGETSSEQRDRFHNHHNHVPPPPIAKAPSWNPAPGLGPLRESRLQNMPQKHLMMPMQQHPHPHQFHPQRPIPQHPGAGNTNAYINENMERFRAMELKQHGGMKPLLHHRHPGHPPHHQPPPMFHPNLRAMIPPSAGQQHMPPLQQKREGGKNSKKGPDITMDAASMLLALRTSASPSTVSAATLEEQTSRDQSEVSKRTNATDQQDHDDMEDDDVPALASSSSSLSVPPKPMVQHHEVPKNFPTRLALPNDEAKLNSLHCFLRSELLEIFVVERSANKSPTHSPGSSVGRVGLRCVFCAMVRKRHAISTTAEHDTSGNPQHPRCDEAPMAVFYPKSIAEIYRLVTSWQRCHLRKCRNLPPHIRNKWTMLRENDKSRGKTHYWITSAKEIDLVDCNSRAGGIRFAPARSSSAASGSITTALSGVADNDSVSERVLYSQGHENEGFQNAAQGYQPHSNPNFKEGPSQKHREAVGGDVSASVSAEVDSPLKKEKGNTDVKPISAPTKSPSEGSDSTIVAPGRSDESPKKSPSEGNDSTIFARGGSDDNASPPSASEAAATVTEKAKFSAVIV